MTLTLPRYYLIFDRAVKLVSSGDGGAQALVYNEIHDAFEDPPPRMTRYLFVPNEEAELVTEERFNAYVAALRAKAAAKP